MFTMLWKRRTKELNVEWGNFNQATVAEDLRQEFVGFKTINPVTERVEYTFTFRDRLPLYFKSFALSLPYISVVMLMMVW